MELLCFRSVSFGCLNAVEFLRHVSARPVLVSSLWKTAHIDGKTVESGTFWLGVPYELKASPRRLMSSVKVVKPSYLSCHNLVHVVFARLATKKDGGPRGVRQGLRAFRPCSAAIVSLSKAHRDKTPGRLVWRYPAHCLDDCLRRGHLVSFHLPDPANML